MSALTEYLKLLPRGIKNIDQVVEGLRNAAKLENGTLSEEKVDIIVARRLICSQCPFNSVNATKLGAYASKRIDVHCIHCGCPISTKTASLLSNCGIETFNEENPNNQIPLKWEKIKQDEV